MEPAGQRAAILTAAVLAFTIPFVAFRNLVLYHFYVRGAFMLDSGLLARLIWHGDLRLTMPPGTGGQSFFMFHVTPLFLILGAISRVLPTTMPRFFAMFTGTSHGLLALAVFWLLVEGHAMRRGGALLLAMAAAVAFAFSGLAVAIALYPHFEMFEAASLLLFLVALALQRPWLATVWFVLALATREDAGLHAAMFLAALLGASAIRGVAWPGRRMALRFLAAGLAYAVAAMTAQHVLFPGDSAFVRVYLGDPPLAHVTARLLLLRLGFFLLYRSYILGPAAVAAVWAVQARSPFPVLGFVACLPWFALHVLANSALAGLMVGYYAFPFLLAMVWPLLGVCFAPPAGRPDPACRATVGGFLALVAAGSLPVGGAHNPGRIVLPDAFLRFPSRSREARIDAAVTTLAAAPASLGRLVVDTGIAALRPDGFTQRQLVGGAGAAAPDTVALFRDGFDTARLRRLAARNGLTAASPVPGTPIVLLRRPSPLPAVPGPVPAPPGKG